MKVGIDLSDLKNELKEIKKKNNNEKNQIVEKPIFDIDNYTYINFTNDPEVDDFLNDNSFKILIVSSIASLVCITTGLLTLLANSNCFLKILISLKVLIRILKMILFMIIISLLKILKLFHV